MSLAARVPRLSKTIAVAVLFVGGPAGCGAEEPKDTATLDLSCAPYPVPEDAPTQDDLSIGGAGYICYKPAPEGICQAVEGAEAAAVVADQGAAAAGCEEGVVVIDGSCPTDLLVGTCSFPDDNTVWSVYPCGRWSDLPGGEESGCASAGGVWSAVP